MSTAKMVFHGSDIEKICEVYQLKPEEIVKFGANVNPLGLSEHVKEQLAGRLDILSSYPDRDYTAESVKKPGFSALVEIVQSEDFKTEIHHLTGYDTSYTGEMICI